MNRPLQWPELRRKTGATFAFMCSFRKKNDSRETRIGHKKESKCFECKTKNKQTPCISNIEKRHHVLKFRRVGCNACETHPSRQKGKQHDFTTTGVATTNGNEPIHDLFLPKRDGTGNNLIEIMSETGSILSIQHPNSSAGQQH